MSDIIGDALARSQAREAARPRIDYARMQRVWPKQKSALTRAKNASNIEKVAQVCRDAVKEWDEIGSWPDDWSLFERTLNDMLPWNQSVDLRDLR